MDLQETKHENGKDGRLIRFAALVFLVIACGLLVSSLLHPTRADGMATPVVTSGT